MNELSRLPQSSPDSPPSPEQSAAERILSGLLPIATTQRWQPLRAGLMNIFLFEDERFPFAGGRLLLRGSNGTGKSRVLAMTLPLLLDGYLQATRVEPDRDAARQVSWNILGDDQASATGYSWLEFGRLDGDRQTFLTLGIGIRAVRDGAMTSWFFITERRVDESLVLKTPEGVPLTGRALEEALGSSGQVFKTASEYRRAVDEALFRLGDRYDGLIDLLLQLRQPQLAKKLDIDQLEEALRQSLPPLRRSLLDDAADALRDLDEYRKSLSADEELLEGLQGFLRPYRDHVRRGMARAVKDVTSANSRFETVQRDLRTMSSALDRDRSERGRLDADLHKLVVAVAAHDAAIDELKKSPEMLSANRLDELRRMLVKLEADAAESGRQIEQLTVQCELAREQWEASRAAQGHSLRASKDSAEDARLRAAPEALQNLHRASLQQPLEAELLTLEGLAELMEAIRELHRRGERYRGVALHLVELNRQIERATGLREAARRALEHAESSRSERAEGLESASRHRLEALDSTWQRMMQWYESAVLLHAALPSLEDWSDRWHTWAADQLADIEASGESPSRELLRRAQGETLRELAEQRSRASAELQACERRIDELESRRLQLADGGPIPPPRRPDRDTPDRATQPGAPLWQLIDFDPQVPEHEHAGWEAALEDAGLLDAWVTPDGRLLTDDSRGEPILDVQLLASQLSALDPPRRLARVVIPRAEAVAEAGIRAAALETLLDVIGVGTDAGPTWVASDGRWRNGPLQGRWAKPMPQYVGPDAQQRYRETRLAELLNELEHCRAQLEQLRRTLQQLDEDRQLVENSVASFPSEDALLTASLSVQAARRELDQAADHCDRCRREEAEQRQVVEGLIEKRTADATDSGLAAWAERGDELRSRIDDYTQRLQTLNARLDALRSTIIAEQGARQSLEAARRQAETARSRADSLDADLAAQRRRVAELEAVVGDDAAAVFRRLEEAEAQRSRDASAIQVCNEQIAQVRERIAVAENNVEAAQEESRQRDEARRGAAEAFQRLHEAGMLRVVAGDLPTPDLPWSMTQALKLARRMDDTLGNVPIDDDSWSRSQTRVHQAQNELQQTVFVQSGLSIAADHLADGLQRVTLTFQGESHSPPEAVARLDADIDSRRRILDQKEQETLERFLLGEVAEGLRSGMRNAAELVDMMTREVSARPMRTGMQMRFKWQRYDDGPSGLAEACEVLSASASTWSADEREQIKRFLQQAIRRQRESGLNESWHDCLAAALDYREWHRIVIQRRSGPEANWLRLTRRTYGTGSGGEKAIALTLPQLAAAAAYYRSADPSAPRFILLDEAFAGVSPDMREECLDLIEAFQLDVVMTSESEWGMYPGVRSLAICQLDRFADIGAVVNRVFVWNGSELRTAVSAEEADEAASQPLFDS